MLNAKTTFYRCHSSLGRLISGLILKSKLNGCLLYNNNSTKIVKSARTIRTITATATNERMAMQLDLNGIFPPITTALNCDETVNEKCIVENLSRWGRYNFKGFVVLGSNGEFPFLSREEKLNIVEIVRRNVPKKQSVIAGAGCESSKETIDLCNQFADIGADAALVHTPHFYRNKMTDFAFVSHYKRIADNSRIPVILYNVPSHTGMELTYEIVVELAKHPNIIGLKDSGGNLQKIGDIVQAIKATNCNFQVLAGSVGFLADAMERGCVGGICALANVLPQETLKLIDLVNENRFDEAKRLQNKLFGPNAAVTRKYGVPALKHMMDHYGYYGGPCRHPLLPLSEDEKNMVEKEFEMAGF